MDESPAASDPRLDELYREHPEGFVARRAQLVKDLRAAGDRDEADRVKKLRRPTVAAWLINRTALDSPEQLEEFAEASAQLEDAQARALEGKGQGAAEWRAAGAREREAADAVVDVAEAPHATPAIPRARMPSSWSGRRSERRAAIRSCASASSAAGSTGSDRLRRSASPPGPRRAGATPGRKAARRNPGTPRAQATGAGARRCHGARRAVTRAGGPGRGGAAAGEGEARGEQERSG